MLFWLISFLRPEEYERRSQWYPWTEETCGTGVADGVDRTPALWDCRAIVGVVGGCHGGACRRSHQDGGFEYPQVFRSFSARRSRLLFSFSFSFSWLSDATFLFLLVQPLALLLILSLGCTSGRRCPEVLDEEGAGVPGELGPAIAVEGLPVGRGAVLVKCC